MTTVLVGLDIETSGTVPGLHSTIEIGVVTQDKETFSTLVTWPEIEWTEEAAKVHKIPLDKIKKQRGNMNLINKRLAGFLKSLAPEPKATSYLVPVGWNVGTFDLQFIFSDFADIHQYFSRYSIDLNSIVYALDGHAVFEGQTLSLREFKSLSKKYAANKLRREDNIECNWHSAIYDARASLYSLEFFRLVTSGEHEEARKYL